MTGSAPEMKSSTHLFFWMLFKIPVVPLTAGPMSSCGSVMLKWNGLAVCATACTPLTASSNTPSWLQRVPTPRRVHIMAHLGDVFSDDILERLALEQVLQVLALIVRSDRAADFVARLEQVFDDVAGVSWTFIGRGLEQGRVRPGWMQTCGRPTVNCGRETLTRR